MTLRQAARDLNGPILLIRTRIQRVHTNSPLSVFGEFGSRDGQLSRPQGVCATEGRVFVADTGNHRVQVFDPEGRFLRSWGRKGELPGEMNEPAGLAVCASGLVYVADALNRRVQVFWQDGAFAGVLSGRTNGPGHFNQPSDVAVSSSGQLLVCDPMNCRLQVFTQDQY